MSTRQDHKRTFEDFERHTHTHFHTQTHTHRLLLLAAQDGFMESSEFSKRKRTLRRGTQTQNTSTKHTSTQRQLAGRTTPSTPSTPSPPSLPLALAPSLFLESIGDIGILGIGKINKKVVTHLTQPYSGTITSEPRVDTLIMLYISLEVDAP